MHITASRSDLAAALQAVSKALPARPANPVFAGVCMQTVSAGDTSVLVLTAGDGENWIRTRIACTSDTEGVLAMPGGALADLVKDMPGDSLEILATDERVTLKFAKGSYSLPRFAEVPMGTPALEDPQMFVQGSELADAIARASAAVSRNQATPVLSGVKMEVTDGVLTLASTDRYRLAVTKAACNGQDDITIDTVIPVKQLTDVAKVLGKAEMIGVSHGEGTMVFSTPDTAVFVRELAGEYPAWRRLLANEPTTWVDVEVAELAGAVRRTGRLNPDVVSLVLTNDGITVTGGDAESGSGTEEVAATATPELESTVELKFNPAILMDGLNTTSSSHVRIGFTDPHKAVILTGEDDHVYLAMPRR